MTLSLQFYNSYLEVIAFKQDTKNLSGGTRTQTHLTKVRTRSNIVIDSKSDIILIIYLHQHSSEIKRKNYLRKKGAQLLSRLEHYLNPSAKETGERTIQNNNRKRFITSERETKILETPERHKISSNVISSETLKRGITVIKSLPI
jgi:hypothetical protein